MNLFEPKKFLPQIDWVLFLSTLPILLAGLITMHSFTGDNYFLQRQIVWIFISLFVFFAFSMVDWRFLKNGRLLLVLFSLNCLILLLLFLGVQIKGAKSWFNISSVSIQPADFTKLVLILILSKYFSKRHIEIVRFKHIFISGFYAFIPFLLIFLQPDFGSAIVIAFVWFGMTMASGLSRRHLIFLTLAGLLLFGFLWTSVFLPHQKQRIITFINPMGDIRGAGYNAYQSQIAIGSGEMFGKGVGYGTQSRLKFLPEYQTDFIFAAFAEEWGFMGVSFLFFFYLVLFWRIFYNGYIGSTNFESLFAIGVAILFMAHFAIHVGMNIGLLPVTGLTLPLMSYGGSHLLTEFMALGILMGMRKYSRATHRDNMKNEFLGIA